MAVIDNTEEYLKGFEMPSRSHELELSNNAEYASYLHLRKGYSVFADSHIKRTVTKWLRKLANSSQPLNDQNVMRALDAAGFEEINFYRSYTSKMRPPVKQGEGPRRAHPAPLNWSDITGQLKASFKHEVRGLPERTDTDYE